MPLTEINVTTPKPVYANYWRDREAARAAAPPPPPWPAIDPGLLTVFPDMGLSPILLASAP
jgi:hypothetical protein